MHNGIKDVRVVLLYSGEGGFVVSLSVLKQMITCSALFGVLQWFRRGVVRIN